MARTIKCPACELIIPPETVAGSARPECPQCGQPLVPPGVPPVSTYWQPPPSKGSGIRFTFACSRCGSILEASDQQAGKSGRCPTCGGVFTVPPVDSRTGLAGARGLVAEDGSLPTPMHAYASAGTKAPQIRRESDGRQVIVCPRCNRAMPIDANSCSSCGVPFTLEAANEAVTDHGAGTGNHLALLVGVLSVPTFCLPILGPVAIFMGLAALLNASPGSDPLGRRYARIAIVLGVISVLMFTYFTFVM